MAVAVSDLGGRGPTMVLAHAAGFCGAVFAPLARHLAGDVRCVALDARGHGRSRLPPAVELDWPGLGADVLAVVDGLDLARPLAFGHSSGGTALLLAEQARPGTFAGVYCFEPVLLAADPERGAEIGARLAAGARRRRDVFPSREEAARHYAARPPLAGLAPEVLDAYVAAGLEEDGAGGVRLACRPEVEARVYETAGEHDAFDRLAEVACPVVVAYGGAGEWPPGLADALVRRLPAGRAEAVEGVGHFGPLERPGTVASSVRRFLDDLGSPAPAPAPGHGTVRSEGPVGDVRRETP